MSRFTPPPSPNPGSPNPGDGALDQAVLDRLFAAPAGASPSVVASRMFRAVLNGADLFEPCRGFIRDRGMPKEELEDVAGLATAVVSALEERPLRKEPVILLGEIGQQLMACGARDAARGIFEVQLACSCAESHKEERLPAHTGLAAIARAEGDRQRQFEHLEEIVAIQAARYGERPILLEPLSALAEVADVLGLHDRRDECCERLRDILEIEGVHLSRGFASSHALLARVASREGRYEEGLEHLDHAITSHAQYESMFEPCAYLKLEKIQILSELRHRDEAECVARELFTAVTSRAVSVDLYDQVKEAFIQILRETGQSDEAFRISLEY